MAKPAMKEQIRRHKGLTLRQHNILWAYAFITVPVVYFLLVRVFPTLYAFNISLRSWNIVSTVRPFVGLDNYKQLIMDPVFGKALANTFKYVLIGVPIQLAIALAIALLIQRVTRFAGLFRTIYFIPFVTSAVAVSWVWRFMFLRHAGLVNGLLLKLGLPQQGFLFDHRQALYVIAASIIWQGLGFQVVIFLAGLTTIPRVYYEAAQIDGASEWEVFKNITIPLLNPTIVFSAVMATIRFLQTFTQIINMSSQGRGGPLNSTLSVVLYIYQQAFERFNMGYASAMTVVLFLIIMAITLFQLKVLTKRFEY